MTTANGPFTLEAFEHEVRRCVAGTRLVCAQGGLVYSDDGVFYGVHVYHWVDGRFIEAFGGSVARADWPACVEMCKQFFSAIAGSMSDVGGKALVWTEEPPAFQAWHGGDVLCAKEASGPLSRATELLETESVAAVERFVSDDGSVRGVRLRQVDGTYVVLVSEEWPASQANYTYDLEELDDDTLWAFGLARSLAESLGRPFVDRLQ